MTTGKQKIFLFVGVCTLICTAQLAFLFGFHLSIGDQRGWSEGAKQLADGESAFKLAGNFYVHPGTTILYPAAALIHLGVDPERAVQLVTIFFVALGVAGLSLLAYILKPKRLWWVAIAILGLFDTRFFGATPVSAIAALLVSLIVLLLWLFYERPRDSRIPALIGMCLGALIGTRIDTALFLLCVIIPFLLWRSLWSSLIVLATLIGTSLVCDPYVWNLPWYTEHMLTQVSIFKDITNNSSLGYLTFLSIFGIAITSIALSFYTQHSRSFTNNRQMPRALYRWLLFTTACATMILLLSPGHPLRYFFPFYMPWEMLLPLWFYAFFENRMIPEREQDYRVLALMFVVVPIRLAFLLLVPWVF